MRPIDADALKESLKELKAEGNNRRYVQGLQDAIDDYYPQIIDDAPTIDAEPVKHGHWIDTPLDRYKKYESKCSECGWHGISNYDSYVDIYEFEYCPYCGAKMDGEEQ